MRWVRIAVSTHPSALEAVSAALEAIGTGGTQFEEGPTAIGYLPADDRFEPALETLRAALDAMQADGLSPTPARISITYVADEDWANAWKEHYAPIRVSDRVVIVPIWRDYTAEPGEAAIRLDPGMAFGTGGHPTTRLCLRALEAIIGGGETVADVGTGSGVLAIGAALLGAARVEAVDADPVAVRAALDNTRENAVEHIVSTRRGDRLTGMSGPYDVVVANILPNVVSILASSAFSRLRKGGAYLVSGFTLPYEEEVTAALAEAGFTLGERWEEDRWLALLARKPAPPAG